MPTNDIGLLNKNYGAPGRIAFREGLAGHPVITLSEARGSCDIALYGAHVLAYCPDGQPPVLWLSGQAQKVRPGSAIRGGIPICWPWFGAHPDNAKLPIHGLARLRRWRLISTTYDSRQTSARFQLTHDAETLAIWPHPFKLELTVTVGDTLTLELTTLNKGDAPIVITQALHTYLLVHDIAGVKVLGLENVNYHDVSPAAKDDRQRGAIAIECETDRVYRKTTGDCTLADPGNGRNIVISKRGSATTVVWNPWIDKTRRLADMDPDDYLRFVCIETANAEADAISIEPSDEHTIAVTLKSVPAKTAG